MKFTKRAWSCLIQIVIFNTLGIVVMYLSKDLGLLLAGFTIWIGGWILVYLQFFDFNRLEKFVKDWLVTTVNKDNNGK